MFSQNRNLASFDSEINNSWQNPKGQSLMNNFDHINVFESRAKLTLPRHPAAM